MKEWFANTVKKTNKDQIYNNEDKHTPSLNASTEKKNVKAHNMHSVDLPWCCDTLRADIKHMHSLDCDMQANMRNIDNLCLACVLVV